MNLLFVEFKLCELIFSREKKSLKATSKVTSSPIAHDKFCFDSTTFRQFTSLIIANFWFLTWAQLISSQVATANSHRRQPI